MWPVLAEYGWIEYIVLPILGALGFLAGRVWPLLMRSRAEQHAQALQSDEARAHREAERLELEEKIRRDAHMEVTTQYREELTALRAERGRQDVRIEQLFQEIRTLTRAHADALVKNERLAARVSVLQATLEQVRTAQAIAGISTRSEAIVIADEDGTIRQWNDAATAMLHWPREEIVGKNVTVLIPPEYRAAHDNGWQEVRDSKRDPRHGPYQVKALTKDGMRIPVEILLSGWTEEVNGRFRRLFSAAIRQRVADTEGVTAEDAVDVQELRSNPHDSTIVREAIAHVKEGSGEIILPVLIKTPAVIAPVTSESTKKEEAEHGA